MSTVSPSDHSAFTFAVCRRDTNHQAHAHFIKQRDEVPREVIRRRARSIDLRSSPLDGAWERGGSLASITRFDSKF
jgi:hypothetical protein